MMITATKKLFPPITYKKQLETHNIKNNNSQITWKKKKMNAKRHSEKFS